LVVSGGHTSLYEVKSYTERVRIGESRDDAIGESFDKIGRLIGIPYPAGAGFDALAAEGFARVAEGKGDVYAAFKRSAVYRDPENYLPSPALHDGSLDFSFSGLKTAVLQLNDRLKRQGKEVSSADLAYCFQETALNLLADKTIRAAREYRPKMLVLAGGVAANSRLRELMNEKTAELEDIITVIPPLKYCTDNAAMIGAAGYAAYRHGRFGTMQDAADPGLLMPGEN
jgi:N6-L-threonylcarbamoyladenine synthase